MVYAAIFLVFAVPAMAMFTYTRVADWLENPVGSIASTEQEKTEKTPENKITAVTS